MTRPPQTFYTSDLHLGHDKVAAIRGFEYPGDHDEALALNWVANVQPEDTVYVLGDVTGTSATAKVEAALGVLTRLPGKKHLIAGNHDPVHPMHRSTFAKWFPRYAEVFETITPFLRRRIGGHEVALSHFPYASYGEGPHRGGTKASRHNQWRLPDLGLPIIHGHTHQPEREHMEGGDNHRLEFDGTRSYYVVRPSRGIHVGVDAWDFAPAPQEALIAILDGWAKA
ncbi:calcineurin-like phosphoesterase family protein [Microbacterium resistens]|uniref:Calcineurin-like phosphoesterase family protein n=1 Tax=Microbacterium resistens TaxID=156977 RepID=A0ABU1SGM1_9MICO|nr:metallophosphoesterase [Microbacterium resistens]MDR6868697.1 calcineurin-like phosphoesterase family protein [Microbacterium resistens]